MAVFIPPIDPETMEFNSEAETLRRRIKHICGKATADQAVISVGIAFPHRLFKDQPPTDLPPEAIITLDDLADIEAVIVRARKAGGGGKESLDTALAAAIATGSDE